MDKILCSLTLEMHIRILKPTNDVRIFPRCLSYLQHIMPLRVLRVPNRYLRFSVNICHLDKLFLFFLHFSYTQHDNNKDKKEIASIFGGHRINARFILCAFQGLKLNYHNQRIIHKNFTNTYVYS